MTRCQRGTLWQRQGTLSLAEVRGQSPRHSIKKGRTLSAPEKLYNECCDKMNIVILDYKTLYDDVQMFDDFRQFGTVTLYPLTKPEEVQGRIKDADMVFCNKSLITAEAMKTAGHLRYIGAFATGYNNIDTDYAHEHNITVCNAGNYSTNAVVQHTFALILQKYSRIDEYNRFVCDGGWKHSPTFSPFVYDTDELAGKTLGIVGYGHIGQAVAKVAQAFDMKVLVYTRTPKENSGVEFVGIEELVSRSDIVTVHCPLNPQSEKMFDAALFAKFRKGAMFINTARGGVVDEKALRHALETEQLSCAAVDTISVEPMTEDNVLFGTKNLIITPHVAWAAHGTRKRLLSIVLENVRNYLNGNPTHTV